MKACRGAYHSTATASYSSSDADFNLQGPAIYLGGEVAVFPEAAHFRPARLLRAGRRGETRAERSYGVRAELAVPLVIDQVYHQSVGLAKEAHPHRAGGLDFDRQSFGRDPAHRIGKQPLHRRHEAVALHRIESARQINHPSLTVTMSQHRRLVPGKQTGRLSAGQRHGHQRFVMCQRRILGQTGGQRMAWRAIIIGRDAAGSVF